MTTTLLRKLGKFAEVGLGVVVAAALFGFCVAYFGLYDVAATAPHSSVTHRFVHFVATRSISTRAKGLTAPPLTSADIDEGLLTFDHVCARCHGAPGKAPDAFAEGMNPNPPPLPQVGKDWGVVEIYWTTSHGVKMTGMPAFAFRMSDKEVWAVAAFVKQLPGMTMADYRRRLARAEGGSLSASGPEAQIVGSGSPDAARGRIALLQHGCATCHVIPGLAAGAQSRVGPSLAGVGDRAFIAGALDNTDANLAFFIRHSASFRPDGAMPDMRVSARDATDIVAYLRALKAR